MSAPLNQGTGTITQYKLPEYVSRRLTGAFCTKFDMNSLISQKYETNPMNKVSLPGYTGFIPGIHAAYAQRRSQAAFHARVHTATAWKNSALTDMALVDLRPEQRSMAKLYMYAENAKTNFLKFPTRKTFDYRQN